MNPMTRRFSIISGLLFIVTMVGTASVPAQPPPPREVSPPLEGPAPELQAIPRTEPPRAEPDALAVEASETSHDALRAPAARNRTDSVRAPKPPPAPIAERPADRRPGARGQWVPGYWDWEARQNDFVWVGGLWQIPPRGSIWVPGRWVRDDAGWYRTFGFWSRRRGPADAVNGVASTNHVVLRPTGPPPDQPADAPGAAPGPDFFFVPGNYVPDGDQVTWTPGFWARQQRGWDWIPARWVRRPDAWEFRAGYWVRDPGATDVNAGIGRRSTARPAPPGSRPAIVESTPAEPNSDFDADRPPPPPGAENARDPIAEAEAAERDPYELRRVLVIPGIGMPYYVIRPPGSYPYGPGGVVVPGAVPPFVRRMLDRVLP